MYVLKRRLFQLRRKFSYFWAQESRESAPALTFLKEPTDHEPALEISKKPGTKPDLAELSVAGEHDKYTQLKDERV